MIGLSLKNMAKQAIGGNPKSPPINQKTSVLMYWLIPDETTASFW